MSTLQVEYKEDASLKAIVVTLTGTLDIFTYQELRKALATAAGERKGLRIFMDLSMVEYIASSGWAVLLTQAKAFRRQGGGMALYGMKEEVNRVYEVMNIKTLLPSAFNLQDAAKLIDTSEVKP
jgi:anti-anti-sigma factor